MISAVVCQKSLIARYWPSYISAWTWSEGVLQCHKTSAVGASVDEYRQRVITVNSILNTTMADKPDCFLPGNTDGFITHMCCYMIAFTSTNLEQNATGEVSVVLYYSTAQ